MNPSNENVVTVKESMFYVNRENPREVTYGYVDTTKWKPVALNTYVNVPPQPSANQIMYVMESNPYRAAYEILA